MNAIDLEKRCERLNAERGVKTTRTRADINFELALFKLPIREPIRPAKPVPDRDLRLEPTKVG
jgi:hypothetical protein